MDKRDFYFRQLVSEGELDGAFDDVEEADMNQYKDADFWGIFGDTTNALDVKEHGTYLGGAPDLTVDVNLGTAYSKSGQRLRVATAQNVDVSVDYLSVPTSPPSGDEKVVSIFLQFVRVESDPRTDGNSATVNFQQLEGFVLEVRQGTAVTPPTDPFTTAPALDADDILLADIVRKNPQATIVDADINPTGTRREEQFDISAGAISIEVGTVERMGQALLDEIDNILTGGAGTIGFTPALSTWADASGLVATDIQAAIDEILTDLSLTGVGSGAAKIGFNDDVGQWANGTGISGDTIQAAIDEVVNELGGSASISDDGANKVGMWMGSFPTWADSVDSSSGLSTDSPAQIIRAIVADLADSSGTPGADKIGFDDTLTVDITTSTQVQNAIAQLDDNKVSNKLANQGAKAVQGATDFEANVIAEQRLIQTDDQGLVGGHASAPTGAFSGLSSEWTQATVRTTGNGTLVLHTLTTPSSSGVAGFLEVYAVGWKDNDEDNRRGLHTVLHYGRETGGGTTFTAFSTDQADEGTPNVTNFDLDVNSNAIRIKAVVTLAVDMNFLIMYRITVVNGDQ
jgi:hypothetical protein